MATHENPTQIQSIKKEKLTDQIYRTLKDLILSGQWPEKYRLPSEPELAAQFGVSRMSLRMALQKLQALGLIEVRVGNGTFVKSFSLDDYLEEIGSIFNYSWTPQKIADFRKALEGTGVRLAIQRYTPERLQELHRLLDEFHSAVLSGQPAEISRADIAFHTHIMETTGNELFISTYRLCMKPLESYLMKGSLRTTPLRAEFDFSEELHTRLYRAIENHDGDEAERLCYTAIEHSLSAWEK